MTSPTYLVSEVGHPIGRPSTDVPLMCEAALSDTIDVNKGII